MIPYLAAVIGGAWLVARTKPKTKCEKKQCLGPRSGLTYEVEEFPEAGFLVVKAADGSSAVFTKRSKGFAFYRGQGHDATMRAIHADFSAPVSEDSKP